MAIDCPWCGALAPFNIRTTWDAVRRPGTPPPDGAIFPEGGKIRIGASLPGRVAARTAERTQTP